MSVWDDRILEWIRENDEKGTPIEMHESDSIRVSKSQISRRCKKLAEHGLLIHVGHGAYIISEEGKGYLDEVYDADAGVWLDGDHAGADGPSGTDTPTGPNGV